VANAAGVVLSADKDRKRQGQASGAGPARSSVISDTRISTYDLALDSKDSQGRDHRKA
jgi:hypothetical protein